MVVKGKSNKLVENFNFQVRQRISNEVRR